MLKTAAGRVLSRLFASTYPEPYASAPSLLAALPAAVLSILYWNHSKPGLPTRKVAISLYIDSFSTTFRIWTP
jgi:hypothetical protein